MGAFFQEKKLLCSIKAPRATEVPSEVMDVPLRINEPLVFSEKQPSLRPISCGVHRTWREIAHPTCEASVRCPSGKVMGAYTATISHLRFFSVVNSPPPAKESIVNCVCACVNRHLKSSVFHSSSNLCVW